MSTTTPEYDIRFRSLECRCGDHWLCTGFYDTGGSTIGYDTYTCCCACHEQTPGGVS